MMFGDLKIPSAGRVRWLWPGTAVGSSADHRQEPNSTENISGFIENIKKNKNKTRANKKQNQKEKKHHQQKTQKTTEEHPVFFSGDSSCPVVFWLFFIFFISAKINFLC